jgi:ketosteroid isomerase-like protein
MPDPVSSEDDVRAIRALNQRHIDAVLSSDMEAVISMWSDDFTVLPPAGPILRGRLLNADIVQKGTAQIQAFEALEYIEDFEEIKVGGDYAFEWGTYRGSSRPRSGGDLVTYAGKLIRILQRQPDGSWKMYRTMTTTDRHDKTSAAALLPLIQNTSFNANWILPRLAIGRSNSADASVRRNTGCRNRRICGGQVGVEYRPARILKRRMVQDR